MNRQKEHRLTDTTRFASQRSALDLSAGVLNCCFVNIYLVYDNF